MINPVIYKPFAMLSGDDLEFAAERAGIREFQGGQSRVYAEKQAAAELAHYKAGAPLPADFDADLFNGVEYAMGNRHDDE